MQPVQSQECEWICCFNSVKSRIPLLWGVGRGERIPKSGPYYLVATVFIERSFIVNDIDIDMTETPSDSRNELTVVPYSNTGWSVVVLYTLPVMQLMLKQAKHPRQCRPLQSSK